MLIMTFYHVIWGQLGGEGPEGYLRSQPYKTMCWQQKQWRNVGAQRDIFVPGVLVRVMRLE
jgi:hypothetical protein